MKSVFQTIGLGAKLGVFVVVSSLAFSACGSSSSEGEQASVPATQNSVGAAVGSIFGGNGESANLTKKQPYPTVWFPCW